MLFGRLKSDACNADKCYRGLYNWHRMLPCAETLLCEQVYVYRFIQLFVVAFALGTLFVKPRMSTTTLQVIQSTGKTSML